MNLRFWLTAVILFHLLPATSSSSDRITVRPVFDSTHARLRAGLPQRTVKRPKIGLVFSGGGARGIAQVGVLKSLIRNRIPIDFISATSMGSVIGGLYASGWSPAEIESLTIATNWEEATSLSDAMRRTELFVDQRLAGERSFLTIRFDGFDPVIPASISSGQRLTTLLHSLTLQSVYHPSPSFDDLRIPFRAVSTDLVSGRRVVLDRGSLAEALRASLTVPLLFTPIERDSMQLVDGGLVDNIPVDVAEEEGCDLTIVVKASFDRARKRASFCRSTACCRGRRWRRMRRWACACAITTVPMGGTRPPSMSSARSVSVSIRGSSGWASMRSATSSRRRFRAGSVNARPSRVRSSLNRTCC